MPEQPDWMNAVTRLRRSKGGDTIHAAGCRRAGNTLPWLWAEDKSPLEVAAACRENGLRPCKVCAPLRLVSSVGEPGGQQQ